MYLFLLGRDKELSKLELAICLNKNKIEYSIVINCDNCLILDLKKNPKEVIELTNDLSGVVRICKVYLESYKINESIINKLDFDSPKKFNYTISSIGLIEQDLENIEGILKKQFKMEKLKAVYKKPVSHSKLKSQSNHVANPNNYFSWKINMGLELFIVKQDKFYFAKTIFCSNPKEFAYKDKNRPTIKEKYNTSFRLASIMINLLGTDKNKTIVDPFCGSGTFLIEGLIKGYNVIGIDVDSEMLESAKKNVIWAKAHFNLKKEFKLIKGNSENSSFLADACVFEPYMGPFLKRLTNSTRAKEIVKDLNKLYFGVFSNLNKSLVKSARVVCILPEFKTNDKKIISIDKNVFLKNGFRYVNVFSLNENLDLKNPIDYSTPDGSFINRTINVLEKIN